ncbi:MAG TPA: transcriptional regulator [Bacteroidales bacterium]|nr:transcriptional regulator [Bacteroidales bacterium]
MLGNGFHKAFENRTRLGIMSVLSVNEKLDFNALKAYLKATDGNLASHLKALEKEDFIRFEKQFVERKPNTAYYITQAGKDAFAAHINALEQLIQAQRGV